MKRIVILVILLLLVLASIIGFMIYKKSRLTPPTMPINSQQNDVIIAPAIIDSLTDITRVPTLQSGMIKDIYVTVGQLVKKAQPLFSLNCDSIENTRRINQLNVDQAKNSSSIQEKQLKHVRHQLANLQQLNKLAISRDELREKAHAVNMAIAKVEQAHISLDLALANLENSELALSQCTTLAPKDGIILQINTHPNEFVTNGQPLVFLGDATKIIVRVSVDERDAGRFRANAPAHLVLNYANPALNTPLEFIQLDQYIVVQERLNSRVQEVLYACNRADHPDFIAGQLFDVMITLNTAS